MAPCQLIDTRLCSCKGPAATVREQSRGEGVPLFHALTRVDAAQGPVPLPEEIKAFSKVEKLGKPSYFGPTFP